MVSSGARYQVIILKIKRNNDGAVRECLQLVDHFRKQGERFEVVGSFAGRKANILPRFTEYLVKKGFVDRPLNTLYDINKVFIDRHGINFFQASALGFVTGLEELGRFLKGDKKCP